MSEVQSRPSAPRGRGSARGGRAGFASRGGRGGRTIASTSPENAAPPAVEEDAEIAQLKKQYGGKVSMIKEMYPAWTDEDAVFALQECDGDLEIAVERITDGTITQWGEVSKKTKDRSKSKAPESSSNPLSTFNNVSRATRGGLDNRGGRGRGTDRGRGGRGRGGPIAPTTGNYTKPAAPLSVPTADAWASSAQKENEPTWADAQEASGVIDTVTETVKTAVSSIIPDGSKTWASIFKPAPAPPAPKPSPVEKAPEPEPEVSPEPENIESAPAVEEPKEVEIAPEAPKEEEKIEEPVVAEAPVEIPEVIEPSKDELTESNVEKVLDVSGPTPSATVASTAASSWDPRSGATSSTPFSALQAQSARPVPSTSGFATSAQKAAGGAQRSSSFQRRVLDQEEAVRMPGNREVDRAAVQFGAFNLGDDAEEDVDGDREQAETRAQPEHSPVSHPRASLPPAPAAHISDGLPVQKEQQGLPSAPISAPGLPSPMPGAQSMAQQGSQGGHQYSQYGRYGQGAGQEQSAFGQKPYDPFTQQAPSAPSQYDGYPSQQSQASQSQAGAFSSAPSEYSQYYTADQQRHAYQNYYGGQYGQQSAQQSQQDGPVAQRSFSGYNAPSTEAASSPFPQTSTQTTQSRYATGGETQTSGNSTPIPPAQTQQASAQSTQAQQPHAAQPQGQQPGAGQQYPYGNPYYTSPYYTAYMNNYNQGYGGQGNYGAGPYGKGAMYNQHSYGMSPQAPYEHTPSPAAGGAFAGSSLHGRDSAVGGGLGEYGRGASQQSHAAAQPIGAGAAFNSMDTFGRGSSYQGQSQQYGQGSQQGASDELKAFGDSKTGNGPSPALTQAVRPGSAANTAPGQSALPPPQSAQQSYGGYPSHLQQQQQQQQQQQHGLYGSQSGSQHGGLGGLGGQHSSAQGHQSSQYGSYGQGGFSGNNQYGGYGQQRGGWGNNYQH